MMTYKEAIKYLDSLINYERTNHFPYSQLRLQRISHLCELLGNPHRSGKFIHIAGTKGKGSTSAMVAFMLKEAGFKVGLFTSPHLSDLRERIRVLIPDSDGFDLQTDEFEGMMSREDLSRLVKRIKPCIEEMRKDQTLGAPTFFEVYTALAFLYFKESKVDFAVLETGLGGRLDATNICSSIVCGITPISLDHTRRLGDTLREIAKEKAGIIKGESPTVISSLQEKEALEVIRQRSKDCGAKLYEVGRDILFESLGCNRQEQLFNVITMFQEHPHLRMKLLGEHQLANAACAIGIIESLRSYGIYVSDSDIREGLKKTAWPGRFEIASHHPLIVLDGAQNQASAAALRKTVEKFFSGYEVMLILGISKDKDIEGVLRELIPLSKDVILTKADNPRAAQPRDIKELIIAKGLGARLGRIHLSQNIKEALDLALACWDPKELLLITGSLFLVGEARHLLKSHLCNKRICLTQEN
jgi:dihydrofolate synthase/folylpolyglutamate synthase